MSVTGQHQVPRRNTERCGARWCDTEYCAACPPHCVNCHRNDHQACFQCGECMPTVADWSMYSSPSDLGTRRVRYGEMRIDQKYCSNACRQKAYRVRASMMGES